MRVNSACFLCWALVFSLAGGKAAAEPKSAVTPRMKVRLVALLTRLFSITAPPLLAELLMT